MGFCCKHPVLWNTLQRLCLATLSQTPTQFDAKIAFFNRTFFCWNGNTKFVMPYIFSNLVVLEQKRSYAIYDIFFVDCTLRYFFAKVYSGSTSRQLCLGNCSSRARTQATYAFLIARIRKLI